jgi:hypothetical protein
MRFSGKNLPEIVESTNKWFARIRAYENTPFPERARRVLSLLSVRMLEDVINDAYAGKHTIMNACYVTYAEYNKIFITGLDLPVVVRNSSTSVMYLLESITNNHNRKITIDSEITCTSPGRFSFNNLILRKINTSEMYQDLYKISNKDPQDLNFLSKVLIDLIFLRDMDETHNRIIDYNSMANGIVVFDTPLVLLLKREGKIIAHPNIPYQPELLMCYKTGFTYDLLPVDFVQRVFIEHLDCWDHGMQISPEAYTKYREKQRMGLGRWFL